MKDTALLIIDVQTGLVNSSKPKLYKAEEVVANIRELIDKAHLCDMPVVYVQHEDDSLIRDSEDWTIYSDIAPAEGGSVVAKTKPDAFYKTKLKEILDGRGIKHLIIAGLQTEYCMDTTIRRSFSFGYDSIIVSDAHSTFSNGRLTAEQIINHHSHIWDGRFGKLMTTNDIIDNIIK